MPTGFIQWLLGRFNEGFYGEATLQLIIIMGYQPENVKAYIRKRLVKWCCEYAVETKDTFVPIIDTNTDEIFNKFVACFDLGLNPTP